MKKETTQLIAKTASVLLIMTAGTADRVYAQAGNGARLGVDLDATVVSKYIWRGYDILDDHAAFQPSVNFDLFQTGFSINIWGSFSLSSGFENLDELDYTISWGRTFFEQDRHAVDFSISYVYYDFPNLDSDEAHHAVVQEVNLGFAMPNLFSVPKGALIPSYSVVYDWPVHSEGPDRGWFHILGLSYHLPIPPLLPGQDQQALSLNADLTYNDGAYGSESGWSHASLGVSTNFEWKVFTFTPNINYQWSFEDTVNEEDEFWAGLSLTYSF